MARKNAIDRAIEALEAKKTEIQNKAVNDVLAMQASIDVLRAQRRTPKPRVVKAVEKAG